MYLFLNDFVLFWFLSSESMPLNEAAGNRTKTPPRCQAAWMLEMKWDNDDREPPLRGVGVKGKSQRSRLIIMPTARHHSPPAQVFPLSSLKCNPYIIFSYNSKML